MRYLVVCTGTGDWTICNDMESLAFQMSRHWKNNVEREAKGEMFLPVSVFELGREVKVKLKPFEVDSIDPVA